MDHYGPIPLLIVGWKGIIGVRMWKVLPWHKGTAN